MARRVICKTKRKPPLGEGLVLHVHNCSFPPLIPFLCRGKRSQHLRLPFQTALSIINFNYQLPTISCHLCLWYNSRPMMRGGSWGSSEVMV